MCRLMSTTVFAFVNLKESLSENVWDGNILVFIHLPCHFLSLRGVKVIITFIL